MKRIGVCLFVVLFAFFCFGLTAQAQTITIGFTVSNTGKLNVDSLEQYNGFELWRDQVNAAGGIKAGGRVTRSSLPATTTNPTRSACSSFTRA